MHYKTKENMKKYKLTKKYPKSPELGTIVTFGEFSNFHEGNYSTYKSTTFFRIDNPEEYPEFWEEIVEKDYRILQVMNSKNGSILVFQDIDGITNYDSVEYDTILQVKRLSDDEVFSIGDLCNPIGRYYDNRHTITKIEFCKAGYLRIQSHNWYVNIDGIEHSKKPLFTTEDEILKIHTDLKNSYSYKEIREKYKMSQDTLRRIINGKFNDLDWSFLIKRTQKINKKQIEQMKELEGKGYSHKKIGSIIGVSQQCISYWLKKFDNE